MAKDTKNSAAGTSPSAHTPEGPASSVDPANSPVAADTRLTIKQIREYTGLDTVAIRSALKSHAAFSGEGVVTEREIEGTDYPPVKYVLKSAVDEWVQARSTKAASGSPVTRNRSEKRYIVRLPDSALSGQQATVQVGDQSYTVTLEQAFKAKAKGDDTPTVPADVAAAAQAEGVKLEGVQPSIFEDQAVVQS